MEQRFDKNIGYNKCVTDKPWRIIFCTVSPDNT